MQKHKAIIVCIVVLIFTAGCVPTCFAVDAVEAAEEINQAELSLNSAFAAVVDAHDAGANVDELLEKLDVAGDFLSEAHIVFRSGDYESASLLAAECRNAVGELVTEAGRLEAGAERKQTDALFFTAFFSGAGLILLLVLGIVGWHVLKERYFEKVLEMRPEVEEAL